jgi:hypothetical protein
MKIHSDIITEADIHRATTAAGMRGVCAEVTHHGSRSRDHSFNVHLTGNSSRRPNSGQRGGGGDEYAATWDEWGMFIQDLYDRDSNALIGMYEDYETFAKCTDGRFENLTAPYQCRPAGHKWFSIGSYRQDCKWCSARFDYTPINDRNMARRKAKGLAVW